MDSSLDRLDGVLPFRIDIPESALADLRERLSRVRLPDPETVPDGSQGVQIGRLRKLLDHWSTSYDWRKIEQHLNDTGQFRTTTSPRSSSPRCSPTRYAGSPGRWRGENTGNVPAKRPRADKKVEVRQG